MSTSVNVLIGNEMQSRRSGLQSHIQDDSVNVWILVRGCTRFDHHETLSFFDKYNNELIVVNIKAPILG